MGLGPLVCLDCEVMFVYGNHSPHCPKCGNTRNAEYHWMFTTDEQKRIENNTRFYRFVAGQE